VNDESVGLQRSDFLS